MQAKKKKKQRRGGHHESGCEDGEFPGKKNLSPPFGATGLPGIS